MTDAEIKKALECCKNGQCADCPRIYTPYEIFRCKEDLISNALDLINRQQEMIDALIAGQETLQKALAEKNAEIERLQNECFCIANERDAIKDCIDTAVEEAIKEFAERLKEAPIKCSYPLLGLSTKDEITDYFNNIMMQFKDAIDNIKKEMVGDAE